MAELQRARKVVQAGMKHRVAKLLFNQPVDAEALRLVDYNDVVKSPMDLGTINQRLAGERHYTSASQVSVQETRRKYDVDSICRENASVQSSGDGLPAVQVKADIDLVWQNCLLYNSREADQPTRGACLEVKQHFDKLWAEAGLPEAPPQKSTPGAKSPKATVVEVDEKDVPSHYNVLEGVHIFPHYPLFSAHHQRRTDRSCCQNREGRAACTAGVRLSLVLGEQPTEAAAFKQQGEGGSNPARDAAGSRRGPPKEQT